MYAYNISVPSDDIIFFLFRFKWKVQLHYNICIYIQLLLNNTLDTRRNEKQFSKTYFEYYFSSLNFTGKYNFNFRLSSMNENMKMNSTRIIICIWNIIHLPNLFTPRHVFRSYCVFIRFGIFRFSRLVCNSRFYTATKKKTKKPFLCTME